jgi:hypothetical protein
MQPWRVHALAGDALARLTEAVQAALLSGAEEPREYEYYPPAFSNPICPAANATARAHRRAVLESPLGDFEGWLLAVDCGAPDCRRNRAHDLQELARVLGRQVVTMGAVLR